MTSDLRHIQQGIYEGRETALAELYQLFSKKLHHFSKAITRSSEEAEEIVEDVFVKLWCDRYNILTIDNLAVYLYVSVKNRSLNAVARKAKELIKAPFDDIDIEIGGLASDPYKLLITAEMMQKMQQAVESLPSRCKMIFKLIREDGLKYKEVAEILNISVNTIDVQMAIATKKICTALASPALLDAKIIMKHKAR
jgi:RNA polymerase sigma-70 factor (family 1)